MSNTPQTAIQATAQQLPTVTMGFGSMASFEFMQRTAKMFASSNMVPAAYREWVTKGFGKNQEEVHNPAAVANSMIALDMSQRMNANPLMIMQNLHIIEGRPSWSSQFIIAAINNSGKFSPLRFDLVWLEEIDATFSTFDWENGKKVERKHTVRIRDARCIAWAIEKATGERLESAPVTMQMAVAEGWFGKNGSKWKSMPDLMMRYRCAAFFGRIYAPELLMGLPSAEEVADIVTVGGDGSVEVTRGTSPPTSGNVTDADTPPTLPAYPQESMEANLPKWRAVIQSGRKSAADIVATVSTRATLSAEQIAAINELEIVDAEPVTPEPEAEPEADHQDAEDDFVRDME